MLFHPRANGFTEGFYVVAGGATGVDEEIAVHFGHLRAPDPQAPASGGVDQLPGALTERILERRAAGLFTNRLRGFAVVLHLVHTLSDFRRRRDPPAKARRGENNRTVDATVAVSEFHIRIRKRTLVAVATKTNCFDQDVFNLNAVGAGIHAQRAADGAGNTEQEFQAGQTAGGRCLGHALVERGGSGADDIALRGGLAKAARR